MTNKEAIIVLRDIQSDIMPHDELSGHRTEDVAFNLAIKALENYSHIIDALEKLKDETLDGIVKFGIEKSIECVREIEEVQS